MKPPPPVRGRGTAGARQASPAVLAAAAGVVALILAAQVDGALVLNGRAGADGLKAFLTTAGTHTRSLSPGAIGDLLRDTVGSLAGWLRQLADGIDDRPVTPNRETKSSGSENTYAQDIVDLATIRDAVARMAADAARWLARRELLARTVTIKVRYSDFTTLTRQISTEEPLVESADLYRMGCFLLGREKLVWRPLRLLGLGVSGLREPTWRQLPLL